MGGVGLVLGAGGAVGQAYHAGVLSALADVLDWDGRACEVLVGTSAGSIAAAALRAGLSGADLAAGRTRGTYQTDSSSGPVAPPEVAELAAAGARWAGPARLTSLLATRLPAGRRPTEGIVASVRSLAGDSWPARSLQVCAVRRRDGRRVVFGRPGAPPAPLSSAVAASCAIPGYYAPVRIGDEEYVDGGAHSPTNLDLLRDARLDLVVVSSPMSVARSGLLSGGRRRLDLPARLLCRAALATETLAVRRGGTRVVTFQPTVEDLEAMGLDALDRGRWSAVVQQAAATTRRRLDRPELRALLGG